MTKPMIQRRPRRVKKTEPEDPAVEKLASRIKTKEFKPNPVRLGQLVPLDLPEGLPPISLMVQELQDMTDVLMGREPPPIDLGVSTLLEVANGYYARASELTMMIQQQEREGRVKAGSAHYKFRTGELRTFLDFCKRCLETGSRRLTYESLKFEMQKTGIGAEGWIGE